MAFHLSGQKIRLRKQINLRLTKPLQDRVDAAAKKHQISRNQLINHLVKLGLQQIQYEKEPWWSV
jgi:predicted HicB family RNase H-like nuclease